MKIGVLGFAHGHVGTYISQWQAHPEWDIQVVKGWDHDKGRLANMAQKFSFEQAECPYCLLNDPEIKAVVIASETSRHAELVEIAAEAGKAIILQKPLALTLPEADAMAKAVNAAKVPFTMAWQMRVDPQNIKIKEIIKSGLLGKIFHFQRRHNLGMCLDIANKNLWHMKGPLNRDIWADDSAHPIDLVHWIFGVPESVTAEMGTFCHAEMPNDNGIAIFRYPGGPLVEVSCSFSCSGVEKSTEVLGEKGYLVQCYGDAVSAPMPRDPNAIGMKYFLKAENAWTDCGIPSPTAQGTRIAGLAQPLSEFLHGKREALATIEDARDSLRMVLATYISTKEGRRVSPFDPAIAEIPVPEE